MASKTPTKPTTKRPRSNSADTRGAVTSTRQGSFTAPGLSAKDGEAVVESLQARLCALVDLSLTLKHIHWNVVGPSFVGVHEMLDPQYAGVALMTDAMAERVATMGGVPNGLPGSIVENRTWDDYDLGRADTQAHLAALDLVYRNVIADHREAIDKVGDLDPVSEDLLVTQTGVLEQYHWFVRSHLEDWAGGLSNAGATSEMEAARSAVRRSSTSRGTAKGGASAGALSGQRSKN